MRQVRLLRRTSMRAGQLCAVLGILAACTSAVGPAPDVAGVWEASRVEFSLTLNLVQQGATVSGTATSQAFINPPVRQFVVGGSYSLPRLTLTLTGDSGVAASFTGTVQDERHMVGVETFSGGGNDSLSFVRQRPGP